MDKLGFVILTWNSVKYIENCLDSIFSMPKDRFLAHAVVIDNGSADGSIDALEQEKYKKENLTVIKLPENMGTTYPRNLGLKHFVAMGDEIDFICVLDSDTIVNATAMGTLIDALIKDKSCGIIGPRMHDSAMVYQCSGRQIPTATEKFLKAMPFAKLRKVGIAMQQMVSSEGVGTVNVGYLMSACWMMRRDIIDKVGLLDEKIFYAPEDVEYCIRVWKAGVSVQYCYDADIVHEWQRLSRKKFFSKHNYVHVKGLLYMYAKHRYLFSSKKFMELKVNEKNQSIFCESTF